MGETRTKMSKMRKMIGANLGKSLADFPQAHGYSQVDITDLLKLQAELKEKGHKVSSTALFSHALVLGLKACPKLNARMEGDEIITYDEVNMGVGTATKNGLMVLVLKGIQDMTLLETSEAFRELMHKLRDNKITMDDITGGTITLSNQSMTRIDAFNSIVNNNESLIIGVGTIRKAPCVMEDGSIAVRDVCNVCININHTLVDGKDSADFMDVVCDALEHPYQRFRLEDVFGAEG